jgi:hypothetical protein
MGRVSVESKAGGGGAFSPAASGDESGPIAAGMRPTKPQRRYLVRGLTEPGGKLPLRHQSGGEVLRKTIESCIAQGWVEPWTRNPIKPDWLVCRLTAAGYRVLGATPARSPKSGLSQDAPPDLTLQAAR